MSVDRLRIAEIQRALVRGEAVQFNEQFAENSCSFFVIGHSTPVLRSANNPELGDTRRKTNILPIEMGPGEAMPGELAGWGALGTTVLLS